MSATPTDLADLDTRIADIKENLRELVEQAAAYSGAKDEELASQRISDMEAELDRLTKLRETLTKG
jgi:predicted  nucleic acid-binding Zn-ribbon protein